MTGRGSEIAFVLERDWHRSLSGVTTFTRHLLDLDGRRGIRIKPIEVWTAGARSEEAVAGRNGPVAAAAATPVLALSFWQNFSFAFGYLVLLYRDLRDLWPVRSQLTGRVILTNQFGCETLPIALRLLRPLHRIVAIGHTHPGVRSDEQHPVRRIVEQLCYRCVSDVIYNSQAVKDEWERKLRLRAIRGRVIRYGIDEPDPAPPADYPVRPTPGTVDFVCVARLVRWKGHAELLRAWLQARQAGMHEARLLLVGGGPTLDATKDLAVQLGIAESVVFCGPREHGARFFNAADVGVLFSTEPEAFGLVLLEAMSRARPVVASELGGIGEVVENGETGFLVNPFDADSAAAAFCRLAASRAERDRCGEKGRARWREHFTNERMLRDYADYFARGPSPLAAERPATAAASGDRLFACPSCGGELEAREAARRCRACGRSFAETAGIPDFSHDAEFYWGELERATMQQMLADPRDIRRQLLDTSRISDGGLRDYLMHYALDRRRAGWKFLTALPPGASVLDFGCGWGALALSVGVGASRVVVSDVVPERVMMTLRRAREGGLAGFTGCVSSGFPRLPFRDASFDLVLLNGVLEWVPSSIPGDPRDVQAAFLKDVVRVLKPDGELYVGIENRFGAAYFRGKREEHTKLRFVSLLPRPLARIYHRRVTGREYRSYTYGWPGLRRLLKGAGFGGVNLFLPYPDYREFHKIVDVRSAAWIGRSFAPKTLPRKMAAWLVCRSGLLKFFANSFGAVAAKAPRRRSWLDRLIGELERRGVVAPGTAPVSYTVTPTACVLIELADRRPCRMLTLPLDGKARDRVRQDIDNRLALGACLREAGRSDTFVPPVVSGEWEGELYKLDALARGVRASTVAVEARRRACLEWLAAFHLAVAVDRPPAAIGGLEEWLAVVDQRLPPGLRGKYVELRRTLAGTVRRSAFVHGDFHAGNAFMNPAGTVTCVTDWDLALQGGLPVWDVLTFLIHDLTAAGRLWVDAYREASLLCLAVPCPEGAVQAYFDRVQPASGEIMLGILSLPAVHLRDKMTLGDGRSEYLLDGIGEVLDSLIARWEGMP